MIKKKDHPVNVQNFEYVIYLIKYKVIQSALKVCMASYFAGKLAFIMRSTYIKPLPLHMRADLFNRLATMEKAGLSSAHAFSVLRFAGQEQRRVERMRQFVSRGVDIASAGAQSGLFTPFEVSVVRAATQAGSPAATYRRLADTYSEQAQMHASIQSRLRLPVFVLILALAIQPLPSLVSGAISGGRYAWQILWPLLILAALYFCLMWLKAWVLQSQAIPLRKRLAHLATQWPLLGAIHVRQQNREFFASLALLLEAGIPMFDALPKAVDTLSNCVIRADFAKIKQRMQAGASLAQTLEHLQYLGNAQALGYIQTGEASGSLPEMLSRLVSAETAAITQFQLAISAWLPRIIYGLLMLWMAYGILTSSAFMPNLPPELR